MSSVSVKKQMKCLQNNKKLLNDFITSYVVNITAIKPLLLQNYLYIYKAVKYFNENLSSSKKKRIKLLTYRLV